MASDAPASKPLSDMTPEEIAATEGEPILSEPNTERMPLGLQPEDDELLNEATDPRLNPDADPYDEREANL